MKTYYLIAGFLMILISNIFRFVLLREKHSLDDSGAASFEKVPGKLLSFMSFFRILGAVWVFLGIAIETELIIRPSGTLAIVMDALLLLVPTWAYAFYLERKEKRRSSG